MFLTRLVSGIVLVILSLVFVYLGGIPLNLILLLLSLIAYKEMSEALEVKESKKVNCWFVAGELFVTAYYVAMMIKIPGIYLGMIMVLSIIVFLAIYVFAFPQYDYNACIQSIFSLFYAPLMLSFVALTRNLENGFYLVWVIFLCSWGYDTCAYCVGMLTGKLIGKNHKMTPVLSPKKSVEGLVGGIIGAAVLAWLYGYFFMAKKVDIDNLPLILALITAVGAFVSQIGDLAASAVKRNRNIKDYGKCIPGHGGILDRFDSMIFTAPIVYFLSVMVWG